MMSRLPVLTSVLMPMRNAEAYVVDAVASVLQEQATPLELVVIDDGSTDRSRERVLALGDDRVRVIDGPRCGISAGMNAGVAAARGSIVMRCDADDLYTPGRIRAQVDWLAAHPEHGAVCAAFSTIDGQGRHVTQLLGTADREELDLRDELQRGVTRTHLCTFAVRRAALAQAGPFRDYFETAEDIDFVLRLGEVARVGYLPLNAYLYRVHDSSITHTQRDARRLHFERTAREFQAQRLAERQAGRPPLDALMRGDAPAPPVGDASSPASARAHIQDLLMGRSWSELRAGQRRAALRSAVHAIAAQPLRRAGWMSLAKLARVIALRRPAG